MRSIGVQISVLCPFRIPGTAWDRHSTGTRVSVHVAECATRRHGLVAKRRLSCWGAAPDFLASLRLLDFAAREVLVLVPHAVPCLRLGKVAQERWAFALLRWGLARSSEGVS